MALLLLLIIIVVLSFAWLNVSNRKITAATNDRPYAETKENDPHSDADMQRRYEAEKVK